MVGGLHESVDGPSAELLSDGFDLGGQTLGLDPGRGGLGLVLGDEQLGAGDVRLLQGQEAVQVDQGVGQALVVGVQGVDASGRLGLLAGQLGLLVADLLLLAAALVNAILMPVSLNLTDLGL